MVLWRMSPSMLSSNALASKGLYAELLNFHSRSPLSARTGWDSVCPRAVLFHNTHMNLFAAILCA